MATTKREEMIVRMTRQQWELEASLTERGDEFQSAPEKFTLAVNSRRNGFEFSILEWAEDREELVISRTDAVALRDWLNASLAEG